MGSDASDDGRAATDPESAFMTLSHELRIEILLALWEAPGFSLSFTELRKTVGERDSGKFTYHLSKLDGHFVANTDDGYELQYPGHRVLDAIQSGVFHEQATVGPVQLDDRCRTCGSQLTFAYGPDFVARVRCPDCGNKALEWPFDPGGIADRDHDAIVAAFDRRTRLVWSCALDGVCPFCAGRVDRTVTSRTDEGGTSVGVIEQLDRYDDFFARDHAAIVEIDCERCSFYSFVPVGVVLLTRPSVTGRLDEAAIDVRETPLWNLGFVVDSDAVTVRDADPLRVEVSVVDADESLAFTVEEPLDRADSVSHVV